MGYFKDTTVGGHNLQNSQKCLENDITDGFG